MEKIRWLFVALFFVITLISAFDFGPTINNLMTMLSVISLFISACLHGIERYGAKNTLVFFLITWVVSFFFEALSIRVGFPFGHYHYENLGGPWLLGVPLLIMLGYFGMAYVSWILAHVILRQYNLTLTGHRIFVVPFIGTFIMVMWDLVMDPISSTLNSVWVWKDGGSYFGVPLQNYFGWFFVIYIIFQLFGLYLSKFDIKPTTYSRHKLFWTEAIALYGTQALFQFLAPFTMTEHPEIYGPMAMVTVFTMIFVTLLSAIILYESKMDLRNSS